MNIDELAVYSSRESSSKPANLRELLQCQDGGFVEAAYELLLARKPDKEGYNFYLSRLRSGERKIQILKEIAMSREAASRGKSIDGLGKALRMEAIGSLPVVGGVFRQLLSLEGNSTSEVRLRILEQRNSVLTDLVIPAIVSQQTSVEESLMQVRQFISELSSQVKQLSPRIAVLEEAIANHIPSLDQSVADLRQRQSALETHQLPSLFQTLSDVKDRLLAGEIDLDTLMSKLATERALIDTKMTNLEALLESRHRETSPTVQHLVGSVGYLFGRVEFVRRELLFQMRYGAETPSNETDRLTTSTEVLSTKKLSEMHETGIRLNLGCGHIPLDGFLNIDRRKLPGVDIVAEVDNLPFEQGEVQEIHSAHLVEHFPQEQLRRVLLTYWHDLLKPGGRFSAVVPDAQAMMNAYFAGNYNFEQLREVTFGGQDYDGDFHFNMLTTSSLTKLLKEAGFEDIVVVAENRVNGGCKEFEITAIRPFST